MKINDLKETIINMSSGEVRLLEVNFKIDKESYYDLYIYHNPLNNFTKTYVFINNLAFGEVLLSPNNNYSILGELHLKPGEYNFKIGKPHREFSVDSLELREKISRNSMVFQIDIRPNLSDNAKRLMGFFEKIYSKYIIAGQHTNTAVGAEITYIKYITGKIPALRGFDFLSYTPTTTTEDMTPHAIIEIEENKNSVEKAIEWAKNYKGIITFCWHWYAPLGGKDKTFYTANTNFNLEKALENNTEENKALLRDIDLIAQELTKFKDLEIPVLWRPVHEAEGKWFWWGAQGPENYKKLYHLLYELLTEKYKLNNLIWIWNAPHPEWKIEDGLYDIAGIDNYVPPGNYGPMKFSYDLLIRLTSNQKLVALTENGSIPDPNILFEYESYFIWFMPWFGDFIFNENFNSKAHLKEVYNHERVITLEKLVTLLY